MKSKALIVMTCLCAVCFASSGYASALNAQEYFREGYMASMSRQWDSAIDLYTKSIELDPKNAEAYLQRAAAFEMADRINEAVKDYEVTLQIKPNYYLAMEYLAKLYEAKGDYARAVEMYAKALPLVKDAKWRSVVQKWMSEARKRGSGLGNQDQRHEDRARGHRPVNSGQ